MKFNIVAVRQFQHGRVRTRASTISTPSWFLPMRSTAKDRRTSSGIESCGLPTSISINLDRQSHHMPRLVPALL